MSDSFDVNKSLFESLPTIQTPQDFEQKVQQHTASTTSNAKPVKIFKGEIQKMVEFAGTISRGELSASNLTKSETQSQISSVKESVDKTIKFLSSPVGQSVFQAAGKQEESRLRLLQQLEQSRKMLEANSEQTQAPPQIEAFEFDPDKLVDITEMPRELNISGFEGTQHQQIRDILNIVQRDNSGALNADRLQKGLNVLSSVTEEHPEALTYLHKLLPPGTSPAACAMTFTAYTQLLSLITLNGGNGSMVARFVAKHEERGPQWFATFARGYSSLSFENQSRIARLVQADSEGARALNYMNNLVGLLTNPGVDAGPLMDELVGDRSFRDDFFKSYDTYSKSCVDGAFTYDDTFGHKVVPRLVNGPVADMGAVKDYFHLAAGYGRALEHLFEEPALHAQIAALQHTEHQAMVPTMLQMLEADRPAMVKNLLTLVDEGKDLVASNLLDMCRGGFFDDAEALLEMYRSPQDEATRKLANQLVQGACAKWGGAIHEVIALQRGGGDKELLERFQKSAFSSINVNLLLLASRGNHALVKETIALINQGPNVDLKGGVLRELVAKGNLELAATLYAEPQNKTWEWIGQIPSAMINNLNVRQLYMINQQIVRFDAASQQALSKDLPAALRKPKTIDDFTHALASVQFGLSTNPRKGIQADLNLASRINDRFNEMWVAETDRNAADVSAANIVLNTIMSANGEINPVLIGVMKRTSAYQELVGMLSPENAAQIERVLTAFSGKADMALRLGDAAVPPAGSPMRDLLVQQLGKRREERLTKRDVCQVIISGLMTPTRQGPIGSCFATSYVMRQERSVEGLRQILEDHLQLINEQRLTRMRGVASDFYMANTGILRLKQFQGDHYLNRIREFTMASMGAVNKNQLSHVFTSEYAGMGSMHTHLQNRLGSTPQAAAILERFGQAAAQWAQANIATEYAATVASPDNPDALGVWVLTDRRTGKIIEDKDQYLQVHRHCLSAVSATLKAEFPDQDAVIDSAIFGDNGLHEVEYNFALFERRESGYPWISSAQGGNASLVAHKYENGRSVYTAIEGISSPAEMFSRCATAVAESSEQVRGSIAEDSATLLPVSSLEHALSLDPKAIFDLRVGPAQWLESTARLREGFLRLELKGDTKGELVKLMDAALRGKHPGLFQGRNLRALQQAKDLGAFWKVLEAAALREGCDFEAVGLLERTIQNELFSRPPIWEKFGDPMVLMDNNYYGPSKWGVGMSLGSTGLAIYRLNADKRFDKIEDPQKFVNRHWEFRQFMTLPTAFDLVRGT